MGLGYWADASFDTEPVFLVGGLAVGFAAFVIRLVQMRRLFNSSQQDGPPVPAPGTGLGDTNDEISRVLERIRDTRETPGNGVLHPTRAGDDADDDEDWSAMDVWSIDHGDDEERER